MQRQMLRHAHQKAIIDKKVEEDLYNLQQADIDKKVEEDFFNLHLRILRLDGLFETFKMMFYDPDTIHYVIDRFNRIKSDLGWISIIVTVLSFPLNFYKLFYELTLSKANPANRLFNISMLTLGLGLSFLMLFAVIKVVIVASPILFVAGSAKGLLESCVTLGFSLINYFKTRAARNKEIKKIKQQIRKDKSVTSEDLQRLTQLVNEKNKARKEIGFQVHSIGMNIVGLTASAMLFFPATAPIGGWVLLALGAYGVFQMIVPPLLSVISKRVCGKDLLNIYAPKTTDRILIGLTKKFGNIQVMFPRRILPSPTTLIINKATKTAKAVSAKTHSRALTLSSMTRRSKHTQASRISTVRIGNHFCSMLTPAPTKGKVTSRPYVEQNLQRRSAR